MFPEPQFAEEVLRKIKDGAAGVRSAGESLTSRIKAFEAWLGKLPGRVETSCETGIREDEMVTSHLAFERDGKDWALYTYDLHVPSESVHRRKLLRDASIHEKAAAITHFPRLLEMMITAQKQMIAHAKSSASTFDAFAKLIDLKGGE